MSDRSSAALNHARGWVMQHHCGRVGARFLAAPPPPPYGASSRDSLCEKQPSALHSPEYTREPRRREQAAPSSLKKRTKRGLCNESGALPGRQSGALADQSKAPPSPNDAAARQRGTTTSKAAPQKAKTRFRVQRGASESKVAPREPKRRYDRQTGTFERKAALWKAKRRSGEQSGPPWAIHLFWGHLALLSAKWRRGAQCGGLVRHPTI